MLLNSDGRRFRRVIGFACEYRLVSESEHVAEEAVGSKEIDVAEISDETCDEPPEMN